MNSRRRSEAEQRLCTATVELGFSDFSQNNLHAGVHKKLLPIHTVDRIYDDPN